MKELIGILVTIILGDLQDKEMVYQEDPVTLVPMDVMNADCVGTPQVMDIDVVQTQV